MLYSLTQECRSEFKNALLNLLVRKIMSHGATRGGNRNYADH